MARTIIVYAGWAPLVQAKQTAEKPFTRELGGLEDGFYMASDFDETPECFKMIFAL